MATAARPASLPLRRPLALALLTALCAALALLAGPALAAASWGAPEVVPESDAVGPLGFGASTQTAVDRSGTVVATWDTGGFGTSQVYAAAKPAGGEWGEPVNLVAAPGGTPVPGTLPSIATAPDGSTTVVWAEQNLAGGSGVWAATRSAAGAWSVPLNISAGAAVPGSGGGGPRIAIDQLGNATVVWQVQLKLYSATKPAGAAWGAPVEVWSGTEGQDNNLSGIGAAVDANGGVTVVWRGGLNSQNAVYAKYRATPASAWGALEQIPVPPAYYYYFEVAASMGGTSGGKAVGEFTVAFGNGNSGATGKVFLASREGDGPGAGTTGSWSVKEFTGSAWGSPPDIAYDASGRALVAFTDQSASPQELLVATREGGSWSAEPETVAVADPGTEAITDTDLVADSEGNVTATWVRSGGEGSLVQTARRAPGGAWSATETLSDEEESSTRASLAVSPVGDVTAVWGGEESGVDSATFAHTPALRTDWTGNGLTGSFNLRTWINYLGGNTGVEVGAGATRPASVDPYSFRFSLADAWIQGESGETVIANQGAVRYTYPAHYIDTRLVDPEIRIAADGESGVVIADGQGNGTMAEALEKGETVTYPYSDRKLIALDFSDVEPVTSADGTVQTWTRVPATIHADGASVLQYEAGSNYGFMTISVPASLPVRKADPGPNPEDPGTNPTPTPENKPAPKADPAPSSPAPAAKPSLKSFGKRLAVSKKGVVRVSKVSCPGGGGACKVTAPKRVSVKIAGEKFW
ncbi:MAG TPA: HtaA domain-containing protein, partial [Solirubrobacterales bacterium]|nr:HtaA domain-containing protein [Solirubrobacterales bacterium]